MSVIDQATSEFLSLPREYRDRGQWQWQQFTQAGSQLDAFLAEVKNELEERREEAHDKALRACRTQLKAIEELDAKIVRQEEKWREADRASTAANQALRIVTGTPLPKYALKEEIAAHEKEVSEARKAADRALSQTAEIEAVMKALDMRRSDLRHHLAVLESEEYDLRPASEKSAVHPNPFGLGGFAKSLPV